MVGLKNQDPLPPPGDCLRSWGNTGTFLSPDGKNLVGVSSAARPVPPRDRGGHSSPSRPTRVTLHPLPALLALLVG